jgi:hypothetical protein
VIDPVQKDRWLREFHLNGFVLLRGFLPPERVRAMHAQLLPLVRGEYARIEREGLQRLRAPGRLSLDVSRYAELLGGALADPLYRHNPVIEELAEAILGPMGTWGRGWSQVECAFPGCGYMTWHPDQTPDETPPGDGPHRTVRLTFNIPLTEWTWANGAMELLPATHLLSRAFLTRNVQEIAHLYPVRLDLAVGDALLRDGNGLHRGSPNVSEEPRLMLDQTYRTAARPGGA